MPRPDSPPAPATPGARFRAARRVAGLTQAAVASRLGISQPYIADLEADRRAATPQWLLRAAAVLGWAPGDLDPDLAGLGAPTDRVALQARADGSRLYDPLTPADADRLGRLGWGPPVRAADFRRLAGDCGAAGLALVLLAPQAPEADS